MIFVWLFVVLLLLFVGPLAASGYLKWAGKDDQNANLVFWPLAIVFTIGLGIYSAYSLGSFFPGLGCFIALAAPIAGIVTLLFVRLWTKKQAPDFPKTPRLLATWLIPALLFSIPMIAFSYSRGCDAINRRRAQPIISALQNYPATLEIVAQTDITFLVPDLLTQTPAVACHPGANAQYISDSWSIYPCENGMLLMVPILGSDSVQTYNLSTGKWSVGSAFDGYCQ